MTITIPSRLSEGELTAAVSRCSRDCFDPQGAFLGAGNRCSERACLEYHHVLPYAAGGEATPANIQLRCRAHNAHEADRFYGPAGREKLESSARLPRSTLFPGILNPFRNG